MEQLNYQQIKEKTIAQEKALRFDHFTNRDAWELGSFMVNRVYEQGIDMAIVIRKLNGNIIFQHATQGTCLDNQIWMDRKFRTVSLVERSSYGQWAQSQISGKNVAAHGLSDADYVFCGGGFPIRLKTGEMVGVITVSNLPHEQDHQFIIDSLCEWLHVEI